MSGNLSPQPKWYRICQYRHCTVSLDGRRPDCKFCKPAHKAAEGRLRREDQIRAEAGVRSASRPLRRASREGVGTRLYVTAAEIRLTQEALHYLGVPDSPSYRAYTRKLDLAAKRVAK